LLKVLVIPDHRLYPVDSGGAHAQLAFLEKLQHLHRVDLFVRPDNIDPADLKQFQSRFPNITLLTTGYTKQTKLQKLKTFIQKTKRKFSGKDHAYKIRKLRFLNGLIQNRPDIVDEISRLARQKQYDIIQVEHSGNMGLINVLPEGPKKIFVHHEIANSRVYGDLQSIGYSEAFSNYVADAALQVEKNWLSKYDGIITLSNEDAEALQSMGIEAPMQVAGQFALFEEELKNVYECSNNPKLLFVGGEAHYPNKEGLTWFLREVYPLVKKHKSDCAIRITGKWSDAYKKEFAADTSIEFIGFVDHLAKVYKDSILVTPIRIGSGIRIKIITAFAAGVPVVSTALGVSGIPGIINNDNVLIADDPVAFAEGIIHLLKDSVLQKSLSEKAFQLAESAYKNSNFAEQRALFYQQLMKEKAPV
jgi:glycosyltransferase involved in cell wall biosynthesis